METAMTILVWLAVGILGFYAFYLVAAFLFAMLMLAVLVFKEKWFE